MTVSMTGDMWSGAVYRQRRRARAWGPGRERAPHSDMIQAWNFQSAQSKCKSQQTAHAEAATHTRQDMTHTLNKHPISWATSYVRQTPTFLGHSYDVMAVWKSASGMLNLGLQGGGHTLTVMM